MTDPASAKIFLAKWHFWCALLILFGFSVLTIVGARTSQPKPDEAVLCNPGYNLAYHGFPGTTLYETRGYMPDSLKRWTYWHFPGYMYVSAAWFEFSGFGLLQVRLLSALFGLFGLLCWYGVVRYLSGSPEAGLLSMFLVGADFFYGFSAANGRMDMMCCGLGAGALGSYLYLREKSFLWAIFASHLFAIAAVITHPMGGLYYLGLVVLILVLDWRRLSLRAVLVAAVPLLAGAGLFGAYIGHDFAAFQDQMKATVQINARSFRDPDLSQNPVIRSLELELRHRYIEPFGLGSSAGAVQRLKILVLAAYLTALFGNFLFQPRQKPPAGVLLAGMATIAILYLALVSPSKFSYYLAHVTGFLAAGLGLFLWWLASSGKWKWPMVLGAAFLVAGLQLGGSLYQIHKNVYGQTFLPVVEAIRKNTTPQSIVMGSGELWFGLTPDRYVISDFNLGALSGTVPNVFVMDGVYRSLHEASRTEDPQVYDYVESLLKHSREIYHNGDYQVYVNQRDSI